MLQQPTQGDEIVRTLRHRGKLLLVVMLTICFHACWAKITDAQGAGRALQLNGNGDFVEISHSHNLNITGALTIEVWIKSTSVHDHQAAVLAKGTTDTEWAGYSLSLSEKGHILFFSGNDRTKSLKSNSPPIVPNAKLHGYLKDTQECLWYQGSHSPIFPLGSPYSPATRTLYNTIDWEIQ